MSVIGLTCVLTATLIRLSSAQPRVVSATSRGSEGVVSHSGSYSTQNSAQPIGAVVMLPTVIDRARSCAAVGAGQASSAAIDVNRMTPVLARRLPMPPAAELIV